MSLGPEEVRHFNELIEQKPKPRNLPQHEGYAEMSDRDATHKIAKWPFKRVLNRHLIVQIDGFAYQGKLHIPDSAKRKPTTGHVVAIAPDIEEIQVGDKILYSQYAGFLLKFEGLPLGRMIGYTEVIGVLDEDAPELESEGA